jgi:hypothetical protein
MRSIEKKCLLHIGTPKTGSTALEKFLAGNCDVLARLGWEYPDVSLRGFGHHDLAFLVSGGYPEWALPQERPFDELLHELKISVADKSRIILSSENFYLLPNPQGVARMLEQAGFPPRTVKVVVYIRRQDDAHVSWYNQVVKAQGYTGTIFECISQNCGMWDYEKYLHAWCKVFGRDNLIVRPYQASDLEADDIRYDFLRIAGLSPEGFEWPEETTNTRINRDILEFQRMVNHLPLLPIEKRRFRKELMALTSATTDLKLFDDTPLLTSSQRQDILSTYSEANARVARTFLGREQLFDEKLPVEAPLPKTERGLTVEKLTYVLGWILARWPEI